MAQLLKASSSRYDIGEVVPTSHGLREILSAPVQEAPGVYRYEARVYDPNRDVRDQPTPPPPPSRLSRIWAFLNRPLF